MTQQMSPLRLRAASGSSEALDAVEAGTAAAVAAMAGLDGQAPALIIVYATVRYDLPTLLAAIRAVTGDTPLVGETSTGHFSGGTLTQPASGVAVMAITAGPYRFGFAVAEQLSAGGEATGVELARSARAALGPERIPYSTLMIFVDGLASEQQALVNGLHRVAGASRSDRRRRRSRRSALAPDVRLLRRSRTARRRDRSLDRCRPPDAGHGRARVAPDRAAAAGDQDRRTDRPRDRRSARARRVRGGHPQGQHRRS